MVNYISKFFTINQVVATNSCTYLRMNPNFNLLYLVSVKRSYKELVASKCSLATNPPSEEEIVQPRRVVETFLSCYNLYSLLLLFLDSSIRPKSLCNCFGGRCQWRILFFCQPVWNRFINLMHFNIVFIYCITK